MADKLLTMCPDIVFIGDMNCCPKKSDTIKEFCEIYTRYYFGLPTQAFHRIPKLWMSIEWFS